MEPSLLRTFLPFAAIAAFIAWRFLKFRAARKALPAALGGGGVIVDVRSRAEFAGGSAKGSINIPLDELGKGSDRLDRHKPVILCCASGS
ncbi:MAG TPA: rhodanese-like domain-containing protein, partial [Bdellovibrionota bacterium]|nr:rhodanese-like domain-containing protein [Bdellovibrionota bacterium]